MFKTLVVFFFIIAFSSLNTNAHALKEKDACDKLASSAVSITKAKIGNPKKSDYLVITNAGLMVNGEPLCPNIVEKLENQAGASISKGSLIVLQNRPERPMFIYFYNRHNDKALYLEADKGLANFSVSAVKDDFIKMLKNQQEYDAFAAQKPFKGNEHRLTMITNLWTKRLMSHELINSIRLHDHYCPGVTSGYHISKYILDEFKLSEGLGYVVIAAPIWCKDDAIQVMLNATVGKRSMYALAVSDKDRNCLVEDAKNIAGIFFRYNSKEKEGDAVVLAYEWNKLRSDAGVEGDTKSIVNAIKTTEFMVSNKDAHKKYVSVIKKFKLDKGQSPEDFIGIGINPFEKVGLWKEGCVVK